MRIVPMVALLAAAGATCVVAQAPARRGAPAQTPVLVVAITVDQLRGDLLERFRPQMTGGLARLAREGAVYTQAYQDHALTETAPGHSTILSGRHPASTGIVRNSDGVGDSTRALLEVTGAGASPSRFRGTALYDWLCDRYPGARALSVSRKDRAAILPLGRAQVPVFWFAVDRFTTSRYYADTLPAWVRAFNREIAAWEAPGGAWNLLLDPAEYPEPDSMPYERGGRGVTFPHPMAAGGVPGGMGLIETPYMDSVTLAFALRGVETMGLGRGPAPDLLAISLSSGDAVGHAYGPDSREVRDQLLRLDRWLGVFLDSLARLRDASRIVLVMTSDHGVTSYPEYARAHGSPEAGYVNTDSIVRRWQQKLVADLGPGNWIPYRAYGLVPLDRDALGHLGVDADSLAAVIAADIARTPGVRRVDTPQTLLRGDTARDAVVRRWQHALPPDLGVGVVITLKPHMVFGPSNGTARHGQLSDDDAHVALLFWGAGIRTGRIGRRVSTVDIAPTLAALLGVSPLEPVQGRALRDALR